MGEKTLGGQGVGQGMKLPEVWDWVGPFDSEHLAISSTAPEDSVSPATAYRLGWEACLKAVEEMNQGEPGVEERIEPQKPLNVRMDGEWFATVWDYGNAQMWPTYRDYQDSLGIWGQSTTHSRHFWGWMWNPAAKDWILIQEEHKAEEVKLVVLDESKVFGGQVYATVWSGGNNPPSQGYDTVEKLHEDIQLFHSYKHNDHNRLSIFVKVGEKWLLVEEQVKEEGK